MNKKIVIFSVWSTLLILLTTLTPSIAIIKNERDDLRDNFITIEANYYLGAKPEQVKTTLTEEEAEQIRQHLILLYEALDANDQKSIRFHEAALSGKGILGTHTLSFLTNTRIIRTERTGHKYFFDRLFKEDNISNMNCYFSAIGEGLVLWGVGVQLWEQMVAILKNQSNPLSAFILLLIFLPLLITVMLVTNLVPFRIFAPKGMLNLRNGRLTSRGSFGHKLIEVNEGSYDVNLRWFTGITISIPPLNNTKAFLFVSGFAASVEGTQDIQQ